MAHPETRSVVNELHIGCREGGCNTPGKDWGGPRDDRSMPPLPASDHDSLLDLPR